MSLGLSLNNALSGLLASQQSIAVISQNIANANNPEYSRQISTQQSVSTGGAVGAGVRIEEINRTVDGFISKTVNSNVSNLSRADVINETYQQVQLYQGAPGEDNSIDIFVADFFEALGRLESTPEEPSLKFNAVNSAITLATEVSSLAANIENLRFQADKQINESINNVNFNLKKIHSLNATVLSSASSNESKNSILDEIDSSLKEIAQEINIDYYYGEDGTVTVSTSGGIPLIENSLYQLQYTPATSVDDLTSNANLSAITVSSADDDGNIDGKSNFPLATSGFKDSVETSLTGGKVKGLLDLRDDLLPTVLDQLDELTRAISTEINAIHNNGSGFPPANSLTGTTLIDPNNSNVWGGNFLIQALDANGDPLASPYASQGTVGYEPLNLDLATLSGEDGVAGKPSFQAIIDEINQHFGAPSQRVGFNDTDGNSLIHNIELVSKSDSLLEDIGSFEFSLELNNKSANDVTYRVTGVTTNDPSIVVSGVPGATNQTSAANSKAVNDGLNISLNMTNPGVNSGPYTINLTVEVDDGAGGTFTDTISYVVNEATSGLQNDRYAADVISGTGDAAIEAPNTSQSYLTASLVDANGNEVAKNPITGDYIDPGYLKISGTGDNRFASSDLNSSHGGEDFSGTNATNFGFSHYFGLNNFFVANPTTTGTALNMKVRDDIAASPAKISTGKLTSLNGDDSNNFGVSKGSNGSIVELSSLLLKPVQFNEASGLPSASLSIATYAAQFLGFGAATAADAAEDARKEGLILEGFETKNDSIRGVNVDEELANTIIFQNAYSANARVINVTRELFDTLLQSF